MPSQIYGLTGAILPIHPQPYPDELLTHWFLRLAHANSLKAQTLADRIFGRYSVFWARDQDKFASPIVIQKLADLAGKAPEDIHALTLAAYEGTLYPEHNAHGHTRWILPLGIYHRTWKRFGLQFCPLCLAEDAEPYFRRAWRLAFSTVCDRHGILMHDCCHRCGAPVAFFRNDVGYRARHQFKSSACCSICGTDLSRAPAYDPPGTDGQTLAQLRSLALACSTGWWFVGSENLAYSHLYFDVLHRLAVLLASARGAKLLKAVEDQIGITPLHKYETQRKVFELRSIEERHWLVLMALWLLQDWPDRFVRTCESARMWKSWLLADTPPPWWFERVVKEQLDHSQYCPNAEEIQCAAGYLKQSGRLVKQNSLREIMGYRNAKMIQPYAVKPNWHWPCTDAEYDWLLMCAEEQIRRLQPGSFQYQLMERDRVIVALMKATRWHGSYIVHLKCIDMAMVLEILRDSPDVRGALVDYVEKTRTAMLGDNHSESLFVGGGRHGFGIDALAYRIKALFLMSPPTDSA
ncbi:TniQ family protein [Deefgea tanakiae]|uniref:TniQ family protein n=1 Tax=Deefgea tanakiae TaxID=2865840 RepID=A0ABX8Z504_9NEIS|nr:TniQ family protein [Deefgea tanakiae]QZA77470.1 TniQ family protein [Deefgea tanakiae]